MRMRLITPNGVGPTHKKFSRQNRTTLVTFLSLMFILIAASAWMIIDYVLPLVIGGLLALLTYPLLKKMKSRGMSPRLSAAILALGVVLLVIVPFVIFVAVAVDQAITLGKSVAESEHLNFPILIEKINAWAPLSSMGIRTEQWSAKVQEGMQNAAEVITASILAVMARLPDIVLQLVLAALTCYFLLLDGRRFMRWMRDKIPLDGNVRGQVVQSFENMAVATIWATLAAGAAQSAVLFFAFLVLGVPGAFLAAGATFIFAWIPILGSAPVWIVGAVYLYVQHAILKVVIMVVLGLLAGIVDNIIRPWVLKGRSDMHPLISLVAIFGGITIFGITGVFLGPILAAVTISLLQAWPGVARRFGLR